jgi:hypothetical protein
MILVDMKAVDIVLLFEITLTDLRKLKLALDNAELNLDLSNTKEWEADKYIHDDFLKYRHKMLKQVALVAFLQLSIQKKIMCF